MASLVIASKVYFKAMQNHIGRWQAGLTYQLMAQIRARVSPWLAAHIVLLHLASRSGRQAGRSCRTGHAQNDYWHALSGAIYFAISA